MIVKNKEKEFVSDYIIFDLETTGLDAKLDKIIEIGALKYKNNELVEEFSVLVNPKVKLPPVITKITGLTDEDLKEQKQLKKFYQSFLLLLKIYL